MRKVLGATPLFAALAGGYYLVVRGSLVADVRVGRRKVDLEEFETTIAAPRETVFEVIASPYLLRTPHAMADKLKVLERGSDMVLAEHYTPATFGIVTTTLETVRFERPERLHFRLLRGPVPHGEEIFELFDEGGRTRFHYSGWLEADLGPAGAAWARAVARHWNRKVRDSVAAVKEEAERRASRPARS
ncbi:MAG: SRPBCC family protein [Actinomycetota bacterium]|nr:SRPBCC family protein [Actinomycetota bacterium]MDA8209683.1 SRPBCC family protein [Actinomycetota bacterium]